MIAYLCSGASWRCTLVLDHGKKMKRNFAIFVDDDSGYKNWINSNPKGLVLNSYRIPKPDYLILHSASCGHISTDQRGNWTTHDFIKICSTRLNDLEEWSNENAGANLTLCSPCLPTKGITPNPESGFTDSLRGYAFKTHLRDEFICCYCGIDGRVSFDNWIKLSQEHLLPKGHPERENPEFIATACSFCNTADNRYFDYAEKRGLSFDGKSAEELIQQRLPFVAQVRVNYCKFWNINVRIFNGG